MLEPTKEPLKPISAAEKIASIGQTPPVFPDPSRCAPDQFQVKTSCASAQRAMQERALVPAAQWEENSSGGMSCSMRRFKWKINRTADPCSPVATLTT